MWSCRGFRKCNPLRTSSASSILKDLCCAEMVFLFVILNILFYVVLFIQLLIDLGPPSRYSCLLNLNEIWNWTKFDSNELNELKRIDSIEKKFWKVYLILYWLMQSLWKFMILTNLKLFISLGNLLSFEVHPLLIMI